MNNKDISEIQARLNEMIDLARTERELMEEKLRSANMQLQSSRSEASELRESLRNRIGAHTRKCDEVDKLQEELKVVRTDRDSAADNCANLERILFDVRKDLAGQRNKSERQEEELARVYARLQEAHEGAPKKPAKAPICVACKHSRKEKGTTAFQCESPTEINLVTGLVVRGRCADRRSLQGKCGPHGAWFEPKGEPPACHDCFFWSGPYADCMHGDDRISAFSEREEGGSCGPEGRNFQPNYDKDSG